MRPGGGPPALDAVGRKCDHEPLPMANPKTTNTAMAPNFIQVARFWSSAPRRSPTTLIQVTRPIASNATMDARVRVIPAAVSTTRC